MQRRDDTIAAVATGSGGAISVIRVSGAEAVAIVEAIFRPAANGASLAESAGFTLHYGEIISGGRVVDDVLVSVFKAPKSYTGEEMAEISCHDSEYVKGEIMRLLVAGGCRIADPGEFTMRAFMNGKMDLAQAEAVAAVIASENEAANLLARNQMRGGYSGAFVALREQLLELASLLELELDFGEEDVEFADRSRLNEIIEGIDGKIGSLLSSFALGNVVKNGVPVVIAGAPNVGKSTLLNTLLNEDRAMVSDIAGTTRDVIEDSLNIDGVEFRFIDTAGIRDTDDVLENMGIERSRESISRASVVLLVVDAGDSLESIVESVSLINETDRKKIIILLNKSDRNDQEQTNAKVSAIRQMISDIGVLPISAKHGYNIDSLKDTLASFVDSGRIRRGETIVSDSRHYESLLQAGEAVGRVRQGMATGLSSDLLTQDIRDVLFHIGAITGEITTDEILGSIFSKFCIGK